MRKSKAEKDLDTMIERAWYQHASGIQVSVMDIPSIFRECRAGIAAGRTLDGIIQECIVRYRKN